MILFNCGKSIHRKSLLLAFVNNGLQSEMIERQKFEDECLNASSVFIYNRALHSGLSRQIHNEKISPAKSVNCIRRQI